MTPPSYSFGSGIVLISTQDSYTGDLASFLFGQILAVGADDVRNVVVLGVVLLAVSLLVRKELVAVTP